MTLGDFSHYNDNWISIVQLVFTKIKNRETVYIWLTKMTSKNENYSDFKFSVRSIILTMC